MKDELVDFEHRDIVEKYHSDSPPESQPVPYIERWLENNLGKATMPYLKTIKTLTQTERKHILEHLRVPLGKEKARHKKPVLREIPGQPVRAIDLGPFGTRQVPLVRNEELRFFTRRNHVFVQDTIRGRFAGGKGVTTHTLRRFRTFFRGIER